MARFSIRRLPVGAEIGGLSAGNANDPDIAAALYEAWLESGILLFRDVETIDQHIALSRCFGELEVHPFPELRYAENSLLIELGGRNRVVGYVYDETDLLIGRLPWHRDTAYTPGICKGAMLRMLEIPARGGETMFADTALAYDDLPADVKRRLDGLEYKATLRLTPISQTRPGAFWKTVREATKEEDPQGGNLHVDYDAAEARYPSVVHPAVLTHPESGLKCIFLSPTYVDRFLGMDQSESDDLLDYLVAHMLKPKYVYTHTWAVNDAILWDNRRFIHAALGYDPGESRRGLRTTLVGTLQTGRFFDQNSQLSELPVLAD
jgi:taurine dioxygenase